MLKRLNVSCSIDDVLIMAGAAEANYLVIHQLLQPGDESIIEAPGWPQASVMAKALNVPIHKIKRTEADDWRFPFEQLRTAILRRTKLTFITNPNNPTGRLLSADETDRNRCNRC